MIKDKIYKRTLALDIYEGLLTEQKKKILFLFRNRDMGISEIAGVLRVSRQAVFDAIQSSEKTIKSYERKLGLVRKHIKREKVKKNILSAIKNVSKKFPVVSRSAEMERIKAQVSKI